MNRDPSPPTMSVCTKFQVDSSNTFGVMLRKPNLTFVTSVTLKIKVTTPKWIGFLRSLWESYILGFNLIAVKLFEVSRGNGRDPKIDPVTPILTPVTPKYTGILPDPRKVSVSSFKLITLKLLELCSSDPQNWPLVTFKLTAWPQKWPQWPQNE